MKTTAPSRVGKTFNFTPFAKKQAKSGRVAHSLLSLKIRKLRGEFRGTEGKKLAQEEYAKFVPSLTTKEMQIAEDAFEKVEALLERYAETNEVVNIYDETHLDAKPLLPYSGPADVIVVTEDVIHIIDLKTGAVYESEDSMQLMIYAAGAFNEFATRSTDTIKTSIIQDGKIRTAIHSVNEVVEWATKEGNKLKRKEYDSLESEYAKKMFVFENKMSMFLALNPEKINDEIIEGTVRMSKIRDIAFKKGRQLSERGHEFKEYGITEGRTRRTVPNIVEAVAWLSAKGYSNKEINQTKLNIGPLEKLMSESQFKEFSNLFVEEAQSEPSFKKK